MRTSVVAEPASRLPGARLSEVVDYLDTHADPADIVEITGLPAREVVRGLREHHDTSPERLLRSARLRGVRRDLLDADPAAGAVVAAPAARWGFADPGRFRAAYVRAFDEPPEDTLRR